jgi:3-deoxy-D-manno-octulosonic-acid transferase
MNLNIENEHNSDTPTEIKQLDINAYVKAKNFKIDTSTRPFYEEVEKVATFVNRPVKQMLRILKGRHPEQIRNLRKQAESWDKNPQALFWKLLKKTPK